MVKKREVDLENPVGATPIYRSPSDLQALVRHYFNQQEGQGKIPTIAGLAHFLGKDRKEIFEPTKKDRFTPTLNRARDYILRKLEEQAVNSKKVESAVVFILKNYGYADTQKVEHQGNVTMNVKGANRV